ncbi:TPA: hypothetical protein U4Q74_001580 [Streptococcus agalactiae]|uniref:glycosyltransferase family 52 n=1 Tax=Streptococcus agalactiae TaxID=1311 RepID=UPI002ABF34F5|nr:glycosyltransferase family 52 [Streptococcus agalactiae]HEN2272002.1 hypothetical protein [Streptococcus agalactiae]HEN2293467.1 hypothetical protein [Streptococcus agalactiae]
MLFNKIKKKSELYTEIVFKNRAQEILTIIYFRFIFLRKYYDKIYIANITNVLFHTILSASTFNKIFTFDDGLANIIKSSFLYASRTSLKAKFFKFVFLIKYDAQRIKNESSLHYTLYKNNDNIIKNTKFISILRNITKHKDVSNNSISICIGQPLYSDDLMNIHYFNNIIHKYDIEYYFPHPRETFRIDNIIYIETQCIFEEYVVNLLKEFSEINLYTCFSSAALNVIDIDGINVFIIKSAEFEEEQSIFNEFKLTFV